MVKISASILSADFACLDSEVKKVASAEWLHVDVMDGRFVPNITIGPLVVQALRKITKQFLDVHLMIEHPERHIEAFAKAGADLIVVHAEACPNVRQVLEQIRKSGCKAGVSIKPATDVRAIEDAIAHADLVLVMSVEPGFGGQQFMPHVIPKISAVKAIAARRNPNLEIEVDGGINKDNCASVASEGAGILVAGSSIFKSESPAATIKAIREAADKAAK